MFSDILMCQVEPNGSDVANVKDLFLAGDSSTPMFDSNEVSSIASLLYIVIIPAGNVHKVCSF